jgi:hypothetical protein
MLVDFLTPDEQGAYGRFAGELSPEQLARHFHLDEADRALIFGRRGERARLGFALQLGTVRFLGTFLPNPTQVPCGVLEYTARQLGLAEPRSALVGYAEGQTHWAHVREICERYGYRDFHEQPEHLRFLRWLYTRAWVSAERPSALLDLATCRSSLPHLDEIPSNRLVEEPCCWDERPAICCLSKASVGSEIDPSAVALEYGRLRSIAAARSSAKEREADQAARRS